MGGADNYHSHNRCHIMQFNFTRNLNKNELSIRAYHNSKVYLNEIPMKCKF